MTCTKKGTIWELFTTLTSVMEVTDISRKSLNVEALQTVFSENFYNF